MLPGINLENDEMILSTAKEHLSFDTLEHVNKISLPNPTELTNSLPVTTFLPNHCLS